MFESKSLHIKEPQVKITKNNLFISQNNVSKCDSIIVNKIMDNKTNNDRMDNSPVSNKSGGLDSNWSS